LWLKAEKSAKPENKDKA